MAKPAKPKASAKNKPASKPATKAAAKAAAKVAGKAPAKKPATAQSPAKKSKPLPAKPTAKQPAKLQAGKKPALVAKGGKPTLPVKGAKPGGAPVGKAAAGKKDAAPVPPATVPARGPGKPAVPSVLPQFGRLLDGKGPSRKPLIASGPKASHARPLGMHADDGDSKPAPEVVKTHLSDEQLETYRQLLLHKRAVLLGDVTAIERGALDSGSGALSNMPSHLAEQGSETYDQSLSLDLAAVDRKLIREIDAALERINNRTFGVCEISGKPISQERLKELPWARYTIEAAREVERQSMRG